MRILIRAAALVVVALLVIGWASAGEVVTAATLHPPHTDRAPWTHTLGRGERILLYDLRTHYRIGQVSRQVGQLQNSLRVPRTYVYDDATRAAEYPRLRVWDLSGAWPPGPGVIRYDYPADIRTTHTGDWACIRTLEEGGAVAPANEFGFVPYTWGMTAAQQSALAMSILRRYGWGAWTTAPACGL